MKLLYYRTAIGLLITVVALISCKKSELNTYGSDHHIFFEVKDDKEIDHPAFDASLNTDSVRVYFSLLSDDVKSVELKIPVKIAGRQLDRPLGYDLSIDRAYTTAVEKVDYELLTQPLFPAGKSVDTIRIKVNRTHLLQSKTLTLTLQLKANENFGTMIQSNLTKTRSTRVKCYINDILSPPEGYISTPSSQGADFYFGAFSRKKLNVLAIAVSEATGDPYTAAELFPYLVPAADELSDMLNEYLQEQKAAGHPVYEEDGTEMTMGKYYN